MDINTRLLRPKVGFLKASVVAVHRIEYGDKVDDIAAAFDPGGSLTSYTGGQQPYHFLINKYGTVHQVLPLVSNGAHARQWNDDALGVGVVGDFRKEPPTFEQWTALVDLCADLTAHLEIDPDAQEHGVYGLSGHDELPRGSKDPDKECPGQFLDMDEVRDAVQAVRSEEARRRLHEAGVVVE